MTDSQPPYLKWDEAMALVRSEADPVARRLLARVVGAIAQHHVARDIVPVQPVDMVFVTRILQEVFHEHDQLKAVLEGRPAGEWWMDDD